MIYDLHTHSTASDGHYSPAELVRQAHSAGITHLALSDHDCTAGLAEAAAQARELQMALIPSVEISVTWQGKSVHIVGLNIDPECEVLQQGLAGLQAQRLTRAEEMGRRLDKIAIRGGFEAARALAGEGMLTRTHFAQFLIQAGAVTKMREAFDRYLTHGKPGYVPTQWASMEDSIRWIKTAGGVAVVAHPQRYNLSNTWLNRLLTEFKLLGGEAIEVLSGNPNLAEIQSSSSFARRHGLLASVGSDFHSPEYPWLRLGRLPALPTDLTPVWSLWNE